MAIEDYRKSEFASAVESGIYLNHAGASPAPRRVVEAVGRALSVSAESPMRFFMDYGMPALGSARERLARLMGVPADDLALTKNTGQGLAILADGLVLEPGDNVVAAECEYPSVVYPWYAQRDRGVETRLVQSRRNSTISLEDVAAKMDARTRVVTVSWVQFGTGFRADLKAWAEMAHAHGALLFVDVIQGIGALPCHLAEWGVDAAATGVHKWLLAPAGTGGLYIAPHVLERMRLVNMGAAGVVDMMQFDPLKFQPKPNAQRYEEGTPNVLGFVGLDAALSLIEEAGIEAIGARVLALAKRAADVVEAKGYEVISPRDDAQRAGLVMFKHPKLPSEAVLEKLTEAGVSAAVRGGNVRFSPHFYNSEEEIERAGEGLV